MIRDVYEREAAARGLALVMMAMTLAPAISPAIGAYLTEWFGWRAVFAVLGGLGGLVLVATVIRLGETNRQRARLDVAGMAAANLALLRSPAFVGFAVCGACTSASWFTFIASAPHILAEALRQPPSTYGLMILLPMATYMLGNAAAARFVPRFGSLQLLLAGRALAFSAALAMALWAGSAPLSVWLLFVPIALAEIGDGMSGPAVMAAALSIQPRRAGTAAGLMGFLQMAAAALGSFVVALLPYRSAFGMIALYGGFVALGLAAAVFAVRCTQPLPAAAAAEERPVLPGAPAPAPAADRT
jgi:DHA1 family bicyclomycin/chloramphenicol resistance-like MFS transporter